PSSASFWPFAEFSPEYQAIRWALARAKPVRFIDLPVSWRLKPPPSEEENAENEIVEDIEAPLDPVDPSTTDYAHDPIGALAQAAGYE
ncbi:DUF5682 family protein, partial [Staphylococcus aureus]